MFPAILLLLTQASPYDPAALVERYRAYHLPEPPPTAQTVVCTDEDGYQLIGFKSGDRILAPWNPLWASARAKVDPINDETAQDLKKLDYWDLNLWPTVSLLELRAMPRLANRLAALALDNTGYVDDRSKLNPVASLHTAAWGYWRRRAIEIPADRPTIRAWLKDFPRVDQVPLKLVEQDFLKDLNASISNSKPPGIENRYDKLLNQTITAVGPTFSDHKYGVRIQEGPDNVARPIQALWDAGFDAVPSLFRHLDDRRITRLCRDEGRNP